MRRSKPKKLPQSYELEYSPSGKLIVALGRRVACWEAATGQVRFRCHPLKHPSSCDVHPAETSIVVKSTSGQTVLIDAENGEVLRELGGKERGEGSNISFSPSGEFVVDGSWGGDFIVRFAATGAVEFEHKSPGDMIRKIIPLPKSNQWLAVHSPRLKPPDEMCAPDYLNVWEWPFTTPIKVLRFSQADIKHLAPSPDGKSICLVGYRSVAVHSLSSGDILGSLDRVPGGTRSAAAWSPDGTELALVGKDVVTLHSVPDLHELRRIPLEYACDVKYSPDGSSLALGSWGSGVYLLRDEIVSSDMYQAARR